ncbi:MAG: processed acidic surface protein [Anaerocolumna sp.]
MKRQTKKLFSFLFLLVMMVSFLPQTVMAANTFDEDLKSYLSKISEARGFNVTKDDLDYTLSAYDISLDDFDTVAELEETLGEVIKSDYSNLNGIYEIYSLDKAGLDTLLQEYGETIDDYLFVDELSYALYFYTADDVTQEGDFEANLALYLIEISEIRGFEVTRDDLVQLCDSYEYPLEDFESVEKLKELMGDVIKADLSNLSYFEENYGLSKEALLDLLAANDESIDKYIYMYDLELFVWNNGDFTTDFDDSYAEDLALLMEALGIDETEIKNLEEHLSSLEESLSDPIVAARYLELLENLSAFAESELSEIPTAEQLEEFQAIFHELFSILSLKLEFYIIDNGHKTPLAFEDLLNITELGDNAFLLVLKNTNGKLLLDLSLTEEALQSILSEFGGDFTDSLDNIEEVIDNAETIVPDNKPNTNETVKGGDLPDTATNNASMAFIGIILMLGGSLAIWKTKVLYNDKIKNPSAK